MKKIILSILAANSLFAFNTDNSIYSFAAFQESTISANINSINLSLGQNLSSTIVNKPFEKYTDNANISASFKGSFLKGNGLSTNILLATTFNVYNNDYDYFKHDFIIGESFSFNTGIFNVRTGIELENFNSMLILRNDDNKNIIFGASYFLPQYKNFEVGISYDYLEDIENNDYSYNSYKISIPVTYSFDDNTFMSLSFSRESTEIKDQYSTTYKYDLNMITIGYNFNIR